MNYYCEDFTEKNYKKLLMIAKKVNKFCTFKDFETVKYGIIMRHDVDFSMHRALALAKIEQEEKITATYFIHLHSILYNILEKDTLKKVRKIVDAGGIIGLHFEPDFYDIAANDYEKLAQKVNLEKEMLETYIETSVTVMSFHNPDIGRWNKLEDKYVGNCLNVYCREIMEKFEYCSDSNGYWRFNRLENVLLNAEGKLLQILLHPVWWQKEVLLPRERIYRSAYGRAERTMQEYDKLLDECKRENVR